MSRACAGSIELAMIRVIYYLVLRIWLFIFFVVVTSPVPIAAGLLAEYLDAHEQVRMLKWICYPVMLAWLVGLPWLVGQTAHRMAFEDKTFGAALKLTYYELRLRMSFLPLIGHWFEIPRDKRDTEDDG